MVYNPYLQNPYLLPTQGYQPQIQQTQPQSNVIWVSNEAEARNYPVAPGNTVMLMDNDNPVVYKKSADLSGRALPLEIYDLVRRGQEETEENHQININEYLTRKEFDSYASAMDKRLSEFMDDDYVEEEEEEVQPVKRTRRVRKNG